MRTGIPIGNRLIYCRPLRSMTALPATSPSPIAVRWSGADAGPSGILGYDVQVKDGAGAWTRWLTRTAATSGGYPGIGGHTYYFRSRAWDQSCNTEAWPGTPDATTTVEALPPTSQLGRLPAFQRGALTVNWSGDDLGGSGVERYDIQYRDTLSGTWIGWQMGTSVPTATFSIGIVGHTYDFRSRAIDRAQNIGAWSPTSAGTSTTFYQREISGMVYDTRHRPVSDAIITTSPSALNIAQSETGGNYAVYFADVDTHTFTVTQGGYGATPAMTLNLTADVFPYHVLPPIDNLIRDGDFESAALADNWQVLGSHHQR